MNWFFRFCIAFLIIFYSLSAYAGTTGKIFGKVTDQTSGEELIGVNVILEGTSRGSATDIEGEYMILNISPGVYTVKFTMLGYQPVSIENVSVSIDRTTRLNAVLESVVLQAAPAVTLVMKKPIVKNDLTSSEAMIGAQEISMMPVENFGEVVQLQAGVVDGHFRGGRSSEIGYMVDGVSVTDPYAKSDPLGRTTSNQVENSAIQEIQVISGTFNAEYGQAMSGIVNVVTKDGEVDKYSGNVSMAYGDYISGRSIGLGQYDENPEDKNYYDQLNLTHLQDYQGFLTGPVPYTDKKLAFFISTRYLYDYGKLYGQRFFLPTDENDFSELGVGEINRSGDGEIVTLDEFSKISGQFKLSSMITPSIKMSYILIADRMEYQNIESRDDDPDEDLRLFKYNPDGNYNRYKSGTNHIFSLNQILGERTFYILNASYTQNDYQYYVYENPLDSRYVNPDRLDDAKNYAFYTGGMGMWHHDRSTKKAGLKFDLTHQLNKIHQLKAGFDYNQYLLTLEEFKLYWDDTDDELRISEPTTANFNRFPDENSEMYDYLDQSNGILGGFPFANEGHRPLVFAAYLQDKIESEFMVVNFGVRLDYFEPDGFVPLDLRDPSNDSLSIFDYDLDSLITGNDPINPTNEDGSYNKWYFKYRKAESHYQLSPRIGVSFPLTSKGAVHFSYGHFFQIPPFQYLYYNPEFEFESGQLNSKIGNAELKPQQTTMYEVGLQQEIADGIGLNVTGFYKDIRNLLGLAIETTYNENQYARYVNRDYGNVRGITVALDKRQDHLVGGSLDYTFQIAEGNSSDPNEVYRDNQANPPRESEKKVVPLDWDQTHTINGTFTLGKPGDWSVGLIGSIGSGLPYTSKPFLQQEGEKNGERKPINYNVDLKAYKTIERYGYRITATLWVYNLFDIDNEKDVFLDTGRATYTLESNLPVSVQGFNTLEDFYNRLDYYKPPRQIKLGLSIGF